MLADDDRRKREILNGSRLKCFGGEIMNADEVCLWLRISKSSLYKLCSNGEVPCAKVGKHWRFDRSILAAWFEQKIKGGLKGEDVR